MRFREALETIGSFENCFRPHANFTQHVCFLSLLSLSLSLPSSLFPLSYSSLSPPLSLPPLLSLSSLDQRILESLQPSRRFRIHSKNIRKKSLFQNLFFLLLRELCLFVELVVLLAGISILFIIFCLSLRLIRMACLMMVCFFLFIFIYFLFFIFYFLFFIFYFLFFIFYFLFFIFYFLFFIFYLFLSFFF